MQAQLCSFWLDLQCLPVWGQWEGRWTDSLIGAENQMEQFLRQPNAVDVIIYILRGGLERLSTQGWGKEEYGLQTPKSLSTGPYWSQQTQT